jgi:prepilin peptidase CpaA
MPFHPLLNFAPLLAMLACAAAIDLRSRRIPNSLTLMIAMTGAMQSLLPAATVSPWQSFAGLLTGIALTFALFALRALGGGDVKLLAASGAWLGPAATFYVFLAAAVIGMLIVLVQCAAQRRLPALFRNSALLAVNLAHTPRLGLDHVQQTGSSTRTIDKPLPYAVPVLLATVLVLVKQWGGQ